MKLNMDNALGQTEYGFKAERFNNMAQSGQNLMKSGMSAMTSGLQNSETVGGWMDKLNKKKV